ncbi:MAG TPA: DUF4118 domain-containing protein [Armatimonadetes bacterium]|nr:DUF4118 domain-containing protein [Armatimonadota bacterium]
MSEEEAASSFTLSLSLEERLSTRYATAFLGVAGATGLMWLLRQSLNIANVSLFYLLVVLVTAIMGGLGPAIAASLLAFVAFNFCFTPPIGTLRVADPQDWLELLVLLGVALITSRLAAGARERERLAREVARAEAELAAQRFRETLLALASHELRTPLSSIKAFVSSLRDEAIPLSPADRRELLAAIEEETDHLNRIVSNLLDLSRLEAGAWQPEKDLYLFTEVIGTVLGELDETTAARVVTDLPPELPLVPLDHVQIARVVWNLVENALKYSPPEATVHLSARVEGNELVVRVRDAGPGLPPGAEDKVFAKFYRGQREVPGAGLGLTLCAEIVKAHGGRIWAENNPEGPGATFAFTLPLAEG